MISNLPKWSQMISHKQALIIFWTNVGLTIFTFGTVMYSSIIDPSISKNEILVYVLMITSLSIFPIAILIPLIGGGFFKRK